MQIRRSSSPHRIGRIVSIELCAVFFDHAGKLFDDDLMPAADHHDAAEAGDSRAAAGLSLIHISVLTYP